MLDLNIDHVCAEAASALADVLRKHPGLKTTISPPLPRTLRYATEAYGRASVIFLLGECGDIIREAPYALEKLIDTYDTLKDPHVKSTLLTSTVKLFFKRPPEVQRMLGRLLRKATEDVSSQDMHDRALFYYRLLRSDADISALEGVVLGPVTVESLFAEEEVEEAQALLMQEFNTLSIMYDKTSENFISEEYQTKFVKMPPEHPLQPGNTAPAETIPMQVHQAQPENLNGTAPAPAPPPAIVDLLGFGDSPSPAPVAAPSAPKPASLTLKATATMTGDEYQTQWGAVPDGEATVNTIGFKRIPASTTEVEAALTSMNIQTMASGELADEFKFFLYAVEEGSNAIYLLQSNISKTPSDISAILTIKTSQPGGGKSNELVEMIKSAFSAYA